MAESDPFPKAVEAFHDDPRVTFSDDTNSWVLKDDSGVEWEWHAAYKKWGPMHDEEQKRLQQSAYGIDDGDQTTQAPENGQKRKVNDESSAPPKKPKKPAPEKENTAVFVSSIPTDADAEEIASLFKRYGLIAEADDTGRPRIKMYKDENGNFKGEALVVYFKPQSVQLAIQMLDESDFRPGVHGPNGMMRVTEADPNFKKTVNEGPDNKPQATSNEPKKKKKLTREQKASIERKQQMNSRLADWDSDEERDPSALPTLAKSNPRSSKSVILKHMFTIAELEEDEHASKDILLDTREEAEKLGDVVRVSLFDKEPQGIITLQFKKAAAAQECAKQWNGRFYGGRTVVAAVTDGSETFRQTTPITHVGDNKDDERLEKFGEWLENEDEN